MNFNTLITVLPVFIKSKFICISDLIISRLPALFIGSCDFQLECVMS